MFIRPTLSELVYRIQQDFASRMSLAGPVLRRAVVNVFSRVVAGAAHMLHGHLEYLGRQLFPDLSDDLYLVRQAALYGLVKKAAQYAAGPVTFTGTSGITIPATKAFIRADGVEFLLDADVTLSGGTGTGNVTAVDAGAAGNAAAGVVLSFESPIAGVTSTLVVATGGLVNGSDQETAEELRVRLIERLQAPPHGGNQADYIAWAKEVAGVTRAWVYPLELGAGTVTVRFVRDDDVSIVPDAGEVTAVQSHIDAVRPATAAVTVVAPVGVTRNFTVHLVPDTAATRTAVTAELTDMLRRLSQPGPYTLPLSQVELAVGIADGITDFTVTVPATDTAYTTGQIPVMGTVTFA